MSSANILNEYLTIQACKKELIEGINNGSINVEKAVEYVKEINFTETDINEIGEQIDEGFFGNLMQKAGLRKTPEERLKAAQASAEKEAGKARGAMAKQRAAAYGGGLAGKLGIGGTKNIRAKIAKIDQAIAQAQQAAQSGDQGAADEITKLTKQKEALEGKIAEINKAAEASQKETETFASGKIKAETQKQTLTAIKDNLYSISKIKDPKQLITTLRQLTKSPVFQSLAAAYGLGSSGKVATKVSDVTQPTV